MYIYFFVVQDTLTILCHQFPLISSINDSSLQCARLRIDQNVPSSDFNLDNPLEITLFIIIDQLSYISPVNININFGQLSDNSSSINEIHLSLLVVHSNFTINNQTASIYSLYDIPILHWKYSQPNTYDLIDLLHLDSDDYQIDKSMCHWNNDQWNRILNSSSSYAYILKTTNTDLLFTLTDNMDSSPPSPYLNILYCFPYKLGTTEIVLIVCSSTIFILFLIILCILQYHKNESNLSGYPQEQNENKYPIYTNPTMEIEDNDLSIDN